jgi:outer membrane protein OmpA-like peptidoglycan-associated protein
MRFRSLSLAIALLVLPLVAQAQPFQGLYIGAGAGYNLPQDWHTSGGTTVAQPGGGFVGLASVGYALGNGFRFELEGNYRQAHLGQSTATATSSGSVQTYAAMANALFDIDVGAPWIYPYIGGGIGYAWTHVSSQLSFLPTALPLISQRIDQTQGGFAFQVIAGLSFPIPNVPGLSITTEYRFFGIPGSEGFDASNVVAGAAAPVHATVKPANQYNHSFLLGVRYAFNVAAPVPAPAPAAAPAAAPARSYLVFFDWDKATLTDRARQIIKDAADNSTHVQYTRIEVNGYTDTSGTPQYNQGLSIRRAKAVQAELIKDGVPANAITIQGFGETHLLVPTGPGVREPQNRRVEIVIR